MPSLAPGSSISRPREALIDSGLPVSARCAERHDEARRDVAEFVVEPPLARIDLAGIRLLVQALLAARLVLENA
jgi:hypothetical protein